MTNIQPTGPLEGARQFHDGAEWIYKDGAWITVARLRAASRRDRTIDGLGNWQKAAITVVGTLVFCLAIAAYLAL